MALTNKGCFQLYNLAGTLLGEWSKVQSIKPIIESLADENSGRNEDGVMVINWVKPILRKWEITMAPLTAQEAYDLLSKVQGKEYYIRIWDVMTNDAKRYRVYTSNASGDMYNGVLYDGLWRGIKFSAIETGVNPSP